MLVLLLYGSVDAQGPPLGNGDRRQYPQAPTVRNAGPVSICQDTKRQCAGDGTHEVLLLAAVVVARPVSEDAHGCWM